MLHLLYVSGISISTKRQFVRGVTIIEFDSSVLVFQ
jgi:hypothetical protein